jgi:hypothetical protein
MTSAMGAELRWAGEGACPHMRVAGVGIVAQGRLCSHMILVIFGTCFHPCVGFWIFGSFVGKFLGFESRRDVA